MEGPGACRASIVRWMKESEEVYETADVHDANRQWFGNYGCSVNHNGSDEYETVFHPCGCETTTWLWLAWHFDKEITNDLWELDQSLEQSNKLYGIRMSRAGMGNLGSAFRLLEELVEESSFYSFLEVDYLSDPLLQEVMDDRPEFVRVVVERCPWRNAQWIYFDSGHKHMFLTPPDVSICETQPDVDDQSSSSEEEYKEPPCRVCCSVEPLCRRCSKNLATELTIKWMEQQVGEDNVHVYYANPELGKKRRKRKRKLARTKK